MCKIIVQVECLTFKDTKNKDGLRNRNQAITIKRKIVPLKEGLNLERCFCMNFFINLNTIKIINICKHFCRALKTQDTVNFMAQKQNV